MSDHGDHEPDEPSIGVGMGGSCPECRAPVDLAQEFCLECGAPIRFRAKPKEKPRAQGPASQTIIMPPKRGFPWVPFIIVLALVIGGLAFAVLAGSEEPSSSRDRETDATTTDGGLPTLTNSRPEETTPTTTLQDCDPLNAGLGAQPAVTDDPGIDPVTGQPFTEDPAADVGAGGAIPEIEGDPDAGSLAATPLIGPDGKVDDGIDDGFDEGFEEEIPSTTDDGNGEAGTVTVDQNGDLCPASGTDPNGDPTIDDPNATDPNADPNADPDAAGPGTASGWPTGTSGWTVVLEGFVKTKYDEGSANERAVQAEEAGLTQADVLDSDQFTSLCPGFWVVFDGVFDTRGKADAELKKAKAAGYSAAYVRAVNNTDKAPGCTVA